MQVFKFEIQMVEDDKVIDSEVFYVEAESKKEAKSLHYRQMRLKFSGQEKRTFIDGEQDFFDDTPVKKSKQRVKI